MAIADWTFRNFDDEPIFGVDPIWSEALLAEVQLITEQGTPFQIGELPEDYFFKNLIAGLPSSIQAQRPR